MYLPNFFSMTIIEPPDGKWGGAKVGANGGVTWNGMVAQLMHKQADICGTSLTITLERGKVIDYGIGLVDDTKSIYLYLENYHATGGSSRDVNLMVYLTVYSKAAWLGILVMTMLFAVQYSLIIFFKNEFNQDKRILSSFLLGMCYFFLDLINRDQSSSQANGLSTKLFVLISSIVTYFLLAFYAGDLTAAMTAGMQSNTIKSLQELIDRGYTMSITGETAQHDYFKHAEPNTIRHRVYSTILLISNSSQFFESRPSKQVWFGPVFTRLNDPKFKFVHNFQEKMNGQLAFGFQKDSQIKEIFDYYIIKFKQSGMMAELQDRWFYEDKPKDLSSRIFQEEPIHLGYENLFFPMLVMLVGTTGCMILLLYEVLSKSERLTNILKMYPDQLNERSFQGYWKKY